MPVDGYHVVFDASQNASHLVVCALPFACGLILAMVGWGLRNAGDAQQTSKGSFFMAMSFVWFGISLFMLVTGVAEYFYRAVTALQKNECRIAEGTVVDFVPRGDIR